jgi:hypothetical protein
MNKDTLIAEFMGWKIDNNFPDKNKVWRSPGNNIELDSTMKFNVSWEWLIPVVEKIESLDLSEWMYRWEGIDGETEYNFEGISVEIENTSCWVYIHLSLDPYFTINGKTHNKRFETKLEAVYEAVVEFIEWYNERKKQENDKESNTL